MLCPACDGPIAASASFCPACGAPLRKATPGAGETAPGEVPARFRLSTALASRYAIERLLGAGGMGMVYLARDLSLDRAVAIKVLTAERCRDQQAVWRFVQEARTAARLRHPHIVVIHEVGESGDDHYFVMDYVDGETLDALVRRRLLRSPLTPGEALAVFRPICLAVAHAHSHGVVHRDLKPSNIMVDRKGHVTVLDFGLARTEGQAGLTGPGVAVGTPLYMSPEQLRGEPATPQSDLYALGLILHFLVAGRSLVRGRNLEEVAYDHALADHRARLAAAPEVPAGLRPFLARLVAPDPRDRLPSVEALLAALGQLEIPSPLDDLPTADVTPDGGERPARPPSPPPASPPARTPSDAFRRQARERMRGLLDRLPRKDEGGSKQ